MRHIEELLEIFFLFSKNVSTIYKYERIPDFSSILLIVVVITAAIMCTSTIIRARKISGEGGGEKNELKINYINLTFYKI